MNLIKENKITSEVADDGSKSTFLHALVHLGSLSAFLFHQSILSMREEISSASAIYVGSSCCHTLV